MTPEQIDTAGAALFEAESTRRQIGILSLAHPDMDMADAYAIQQAFVTRKSAAGGKVIGWKIGLTSKAMRDALKIDIPDSGILFDDMVFANGCVVPAGRFIQPRIEAEIAFVMKAPLRGPGVTRDDVVAATDYVAPALEILDTRIQRRDAATGTLRKIVDTIADNAANAGIVMGDDHHRIDAVDLRWAGAIVSKDGEVEETGLGAGVLDDPALAIAWLANRLAEYGKWIEPGQVVLSGSFIRPVEATPGSRIAADFGGFGHVAVDFA
ncbi:MAG: 2-oxo-hepta-3-ene-1,7-dioic acid hydratase [Rhodobacter sp.]|nr:2-oxo-hepta-3-ene-1,7-dioic acid hydratase [Rhodobacter sp.]